MDLRRLTEAAFLAEQDLSRESPVTGGAADEVEATILAEMELDNLNRLLVLGQYGAYRIIALNSTDTGLIDANDRLVGYYIGEALVIEEKARGQGLSVPLILHAVPNRPVPTRRKLTAAGEAALRKAFRVANGTEENPWWPRALIQRWVKQRF